MTDFELPDQFLYSRKGPWPQPSPSHPMQCADEVLNIPPMEALFFNEAIGARYLRDRVGYPPQAGAYAAAQRDWTGPTRERFDEILFSTLYTRFLKPLSKADVAACAGELELEGQDKWWKYDFGAMDLVEPIAGTFCAPTRLFIRERPDGRRSCVCIQVHRDRPLYVRPEDDAWGLAMLYALQGAAYHVLFVVHPALHFPMDSVNAITKTSVPMAHPLFQLLEPHSRYALPLDNAVLESAETVVNNNAQGTRFDPLTANAYNLKLLFGAGYRGLPQSEYGDAYPPYRYDRPAMGFDSDYGRWLGAYYEQAFLPFCRRVAKHILDPHANGRSNLREYVGRWARYNHTHVLGFPDEAGILTLEGLSEAMAIYIWNASVAHGGDHASFANQIEPVEKCLRIRRPPPRDRNDPPVQSGQIFNGDDMARAALCQELFFQTWAIPPNLDETYYAFTEPELQAAVQQFHQDLLAVSRDQTLHHFMPLRADPHAEPPVPYVRTIPQSIQY